MKPKFTHDCDCCKYLGTHEEHDLYYCDGGFMPTVIARWSDYGPDYTSGLSFVKHIPVLGEASKRAIEKGYTTQQAIDYWS